jgi:hypothetical protein
MGGDFLSSGNHVEIGIRIKHFFHTIVNSASRLPSLLGRRQSVYTSEYFAPMQALRFRPSNSPRPSQLAHEVCSAILANHSCGRLHLSRDPTIFLPGPHKAFRYS